MISAVDTSVLLDVLCDDPKHYASSSENLRRGMAEGTMVICDCVIAEIRPALNEKELCLFLADWKIRFVPSSLESAMLAGRNFAEYLRRGGTARRVLQDFLIGAHAQIHADRLFARDRGYLRDYFKGLQVVG